jgi:hypothetical protein
LILLREEDLTTDPAIAMFTSNDAVLPFPLRASLDRVDSQMDQLIYQAANKGFLNFKIFNPSH